MDRLPKTRRDILAFCGGIFLTGVSGCQRLADGGSDETPQAEPLPINHDTYTDHPQIEETPETDPTTVRNGTPDSLLDDSHTRCSFTFETIDSSPENTDAVSISDQELADLTVLREIFETATNSESNPREASSFKGSTVGADTEAEYEEIHKFLQSTPTLSPDEDGYPMGTYIEYDGTLIVVTEFCRT